MKVDVKLSTQNLKLKTASVTDPAHTSCPCRAEVNFTQGVGEKKKTVMNDVDNLMSTLVSYNRLPDYVSEGFSATVAETLEISAKSIRTLLRTI